MENFLLKGILIGTLFGMPFGAVGAMTVQRILTRGPRAGIISGLGSSAADCIYACAGAFGLTIISDFLLKNQLLINMLGGGLILIMGIMMMVRKRESKPEEVKGMGMTGMFLSSFAVCITNPAAVLSFLFAFSYFGISGRLNAVDGCGLVLGVFLGTLVWWGLLAAVVGKLRHKAGQRCIRNINKIFGVLLILFGLTIYVRIVHGG